MTLTKIMFFSDEIRLDVHTATRGKDVGKRLSIREFSKGKPCRLSQRDNGEFICEIVEMNRFGRWEEIAFIEGPEV